MSSVGKLSSSDSTSHSQQIPSISPTMMREPPSLHPLHLLDDFLLSLTQSEININDNGTSTAPSDKSVSVDTKTQNDSESTSRKNLFSSSQSQKERTVHRPVAQEMNNVQKQQLILKTCDFLYGIGAGSNASNSSSSILEAALCLLDTAPSVGETRSHDHVPVRLVRAVPSGRSIIIVRGSSTSGTNTNENRWQSNCNGGYEAKKNEYLCLLGTSTVSPKSRMSAGAAVGRVAYHCTCRSFYDRSKQGRFALCKHLLAARLAPYLDTIDCRDGSGDNCNSYGLYSEESINDEDFGKLVASKFS